jgi:hypothetical protein
MLVWQQKNWLVLIKLDNSKISKLSKTEFDNINNSDWLCVTFFWLASILVACHPEIWVAWGLWVHRRVFLRWDQEGVESASPSGTTSSRGPEVYLELDRPSLIPNKISSFPKNCFLLFVQYVLRVQIIFLKSLELSL